MPVNFKAAPYELRITMAPGPEACLVYGVYNTDTGVCEAYISQLARAKAVCTQFARDLAHGMRTEEELTKIISDHFASLTEEDFADDMPTPPKGKSN